MLVLGEARQIGVVGSVAVAKDQRAIRTLVMIVVSDLDDGKCPYDQSLLDLEEGTIPEMEPHKKLTGATGCGGVVEKLELFDHNLTA